MKVEFFIHGVTAKGQEHWCEERCNFPKYLEPFYNQKRTESEVMDVEISAEGTAKYACYTYLRYGNIGAMLSDGKAGRDGSYFGITVKTEGNLYCNLGNLYSILSNVFNKFIDGVLLKSNGDKSYSYTVPTFESADAQLRKAKEAFMTIFGASAAGKDFVAIPPKCSSKGTICNIHTSESSFPSVSKLILDGSKVRVAPSFVPQQYQAAIQKAMTDAQNAIQKKDNEVKSQLEQKDKEVKRKLEQKDNEVKGQLEQKEQECNSRLQQKDSEIKSLQDSNKNVKKLREEKERLDGELSKANKKIAQMETDKETEKSTRKTEIDRIIEEIGGPLDRLYILAGKRFHQNTTSDIQAHTNSGNPRGKDNHFGFWGIIEKVSKIASVLTFCVVVFIAAKTMAPGHSEPKPTPTDTVIEDTIANIVIQDTAKKEGAPVVDPEPVQSSPTPKKAQTAFLNISKTDGKSLVKGEEYTFSLTVNKRRVTENGYFTVNNQVQTSATFKIPEDYSGLTIEIAYVSLSGNYKAEKRILNVINKQ